MAQPSAGRSFAPAKARFVNVAPLRKLLPDLARPKPARGRPRPEPKPLKKRRYGMIPETDVDFHPERAEEEARRAAEAHFARRVRREVLRVQSGEADEDLRADAEAEAEAARATEERRAREERRRSNPLFRLVSGTILVGEQATRYYPYLFTFAALFFLNIVVLFWSLHLDSRYSRLEREVQKLRERSIRLEERRYSITTHSAVVRELERRGIPLADPAAPVEIIEE